MTLEEFPLFGFVESVQLYKMRKEQAADQGLCWATAVHQPK